MKIKLLFILLIFITGTEVGLATPEDLNITKKSVLNIINAMTDNNGQLIGYGTGTGFLINSKGYLLTNNHVIAAEAGLNSSLLVVDGDSIAEENLKPAKLIWTSKEKDIAIIQATTISDRPTVKFIDTMPLIGSDIFAIGYPGVTTSHRLDAQNVEAVINKGSLSLLINEGINGIATQVLQHDVPINPGNSGGPLVDVCGSVIGINTAGVVSRGIQGVFYASHIQASMDILDRQNIAYEVNSTNCAMGTTGNSRDILWLSVLAVLVFLFTIAFSFRKPREKIICSIESYTQYLRRQGNNHSNTPQPINPTSPSQSKTWQLSGRVKTTNEKLELILTENELRQGITIGRNQQLCDYSIPEKKLSRKHLRLSYQKNGILIEDLNSGNGTYIDNQRLKPGKPKILNIGSHLNLANVITFRLNQ
ncbi:MAG: trypsin-like peptidase domain-containing protein [Thiomargarita sp.]|nr:trypsin-like peptidase domain-containing protein [Thiomargarita sp.]